MESLRNLTIGDLRRKEKAKGRHPSWLNHEVRALNRIWNKSLSKEPCRKCGYRLHVELAHLKPITSFSDNTPLKVVNDPSNLVPFCPNCHWEFDRGLFKVDDIPLTNRKSIPCCFCSCPIYRSDSEVETGKLFCSDQCSENFRVKRTWPKKEVLKNLVFECPIVLLAKQLGVSDTAVKKRCRKLGIHTPKRGYWAKYRSKTAPQRGIEPPTYGLGNHRSVR